LASLFKDKKSKKAAKAKKHVKSKAELETDKLVAQQKQMLKHQKKAILDDRASKQDLGESKDGDAMVGLFSDKSKKAAKKAKMHVKSKAELETDHLVAQQKQMLKQQKQAIADKKDAENDLGESQTSTADAMSSLFVKKNKPKKTVKKVQQEDDGLPSWMSEKDKQELREAKKRQQRLLDSMTGRSTAAVQADEGQSAAQKDQRVVNAFSQHFGLKAREPATESPVVGEGIIVDGSGRVEKNQKNEPSGATDDGDTAAKSEPSSTNDDNAATIIVDGSGHVEKNQKNEPSSATDNGDTGPYSIEATPTAASGSADSNDDEDGGKAVGTHAASKSFDSDAGDLAVAGALPAPARADQSDNMSDEEAAAALMGESDSTSDDAAAALKSRVTDPTGDVLAQSTAYEKHHAGAVAFDFEGGSSQPASDSLASEMKDLKKQMHQKPMSKKEKSKAMLSRLSNLFSTYTENL